MMLPETSWEPGYAVLFANCVRCGAMCQGDPDTMPSFRVHEGTRCPWRPDGTEVQPGQPDTLRVPACPGCVAAAKAANGGRFPWPAARQDAFLPGVWDQLPKSSGR